MDPLRKPTDVRKKSAVAVPPPSDLPESEPRVPLSAEDLADLTRIGDPNLSEPIRVAKVTEYRGVAGIAHNLFSSVKRGLPTEKIEENIRLYGKNEYPQKKPKTFLELFWDALTDQTMLILVAAAVVSLILGIFFPQEGEQGSGWIEGVAIIISVLVVCTVTAGNNWMKERQFRALNELSAKEQSVRVIRNGAPQNVFTSNIVVGDLVLLNMGDAIPADGVYIHGTELKIDEASMTGEPMPIRKENDKPFVLAGCTVADGSGQMLVTSVGINTEWGRTLEKVQDEDDDDSTPMQRTLADMAEMIGWVGLAVAALVFALLCIYWVIDIGTKDRYFSWSSAPELLQFLIVAITIVVVAVPEGLPLAVTICLAYSVRAMMTDNNMVRNLASCEVMGGATNICSDKTGTLTQNKMTVVTGALAGVAWPEGGDLPKDQLRADVLELIFENVCVNNQADLEEKDGETKFVGNPTDCALLLFARKHGTNYRTLRDHATYVQKYPFTSAKKRMSTVLKVTSPPAGSPERFRIHIKGASEIVLSRCTSLMQSDGTIVPLTPQKTEELKALISGMASQALRTIGIGFRDTTEELAWSEMVANPPDENFTCLGIVGILDPLRPEVRDAVRKCKGAGIFVRMVTGDNIDTAKKIAEQCGIFDKDVGMAIEGPAFAKLSPQEIDEILPKLQVLARSSPTDKHTLVTRLRKNQQIVAVTGDGTNDAPALKKAHVGLAMGIAGTAVAKMAADITIMDDNFSSIVKTVMWGRNIFDNIRKFLQFQLTVNLAALVTAFVSAASKQGEPLKPVQLLWVNLIMDTMAALALATDRPTEALLNRKPINVLQQRFISNRMIKHIVGQAVYQVIVLLTIVYVGDKIFSVERLTDHHFAIIFNAFVWCQLFNEVNCRKVNDELNIFEGFFKNYIYIGVMFIEILFQVLIVQFGGKAFHVVPLNIWEWLACLGIGAFSLVVGFFLRMWPMPEAIDTARYNVEVKGTEAEKKAHKKAAKAEKKAAKGDKKKKDK